MSSSSLQPSAIIDTVKAFGWLFFSLMGSGLILLILLAPLRVR
jgi:hypothetical protein